MASKTHPLLAVFDVFFHVYMDSAELVDALIDLDVPGGNQVGGNMKIFFFFRAVRRLCQFSRVGSGRGRVGSG